MRRTETPKPIWIKFCTVVDIPDVVTYTNFGDHRLRGFWVAGGVKFPPLPLTFIVALTTLSHYRASVWFNIYTFSSLTHLQVRPVDGFLRLMAQTTRTRARMCFLGVLLILPPFCDEIPKKTILGAWLGVFKPSRQNNWKFYVIETTASILTKFGTTIETTNWSSSEVAVGAQQIQDGGRLILMKFGTMTHIGLWQRINR